MRTEIRLGCTPSNSAASCARIQRNLAYAEGAHIRPLSTRGGPDTEENLLCLCPNHHVSFDRGALYPTTDLDIVDAESGNVVGRLRLKDGHTINGEQVAFLRALFGF